MKPFRLNNRRTRILMVLMTIMALLFVQTPLLHIHGPHDHAGHMANLDQHHTEVHIASIDISDDTTDLASEIDLSAKGVVKNIKFTPPLLAVLTLVIVLLISQHVSNRRWLIRYETFFNRFNPLLRPPLRAPPL